MLYAKMLRLASLAIIAGSSVWQLGCDQGAIDPPEVAVEKRAQARWDKLLEGDMEGAYSYLSPREREEMSLEAFKGRFGSAVSWTSAKVLEVSCEPSECFVKLQVGYKAVLPQMAQIGEVENTRFVRERWIYSADDWWKTESRGTQKNVDVPSG